MPYKSQICTCNPHKWEYCQLHGWDRWPGIVTLRLLNYLKYGKWVGPISNRSEVT